MAVTHDHSRLIVYGGYSKERIKRDVDRGQIHSDMFALMFDSMSYQCREMLHNFVQFYVYVFKLYACMYTALASLNWQHGHMAFF